MWKPIDDASHQRTAVLSPATKTRWAHRRRLLALVLVMVTFIAYQPVWRAGFIWDDNSHVTENVNLRSLHGLHQIWFEPLADQQYYPLQLTSYWIEYHLWGLRPFGYHAINVLLHALNALLLWMVLQQLEVPCAWLAAAVFAVHPVQVESVAWISELKNLLSTTFYLATVLAFFRFRPLSNEVHEGSPPWRFYWLALALFLCALLSKTVACSLPAVLVLLLWWKKEQVERRDVAVLSPMFLIGITFGLTTAWLEKHHAGARGAEWSLSFLQRCLLAGRALWFYAGKLLWPRPLIFIYPHWEIDPGAWWQYLYPAAALAVLVALWSLRSRIGRGPLVAALCFACTLFPALGFFDVFPFRYSYVADHFSYLASMGFITLVIAGFTTIIKPRQAVALLSAAVVVLLGWRTWQHSHDFYDSETLWRATLHENPGATLAHNNLGNLYQANGQLDRALFHLQQAAQLEPNYAEVHNNLGIVLARLGRPNDAAGQFAEAIRLSPDRPDIQFNFAHVLEQLGQVDIAIERLRAGMKFGTPTTEDYLYLSRLLVKTKGYAEAIETLRRAHQAAPAQLHVADELAWLLAACPDPHLRRPDEAIQLSEQLCTQTQHHVPELLDTLAACYAASGRFPDAVELARQAVHLAEAQQQLSLAASIHSRLDGYGEQRPASYDQHDNAASPR
jgi:tetratricopeptide (TPR) repeat protein